MEDHHQRIEELFEILIELPDEERDAYLQRELPDQPELWAEVMSLVRYDRPPADTFQGARILVDSSRTPTLSVDDKLPSGPTPKQGDQIGPYRLTEILGEGGMGVVYRAEQSEPIQRQVALKIIKLGMDSREVIARFEAERQALALMNHPSVAKVLDAGSTADGRPYFVMELVDGVPITRYRQEKNLTTGQLLELFIPVCEAIQHAHQKGIIHRDIKPSNVLVAESDGKPNAVVIDFGIAKAIHTPLTHRTLQTQNMFLGTPEYMSPEQASLSGLDIDTRSDIYSLGVLLYELLTGTTPFDSEMLREAGYLEIHRIIREVDPPKPSTRISTLGVSRTSLEARTTTQTRGKTVRGDLDWIVMKCLEKERNRRYSSPSELVLDLRRHLNFEPVLAGPPSAWYRTRKFVRKHQVGVAATSVVAVSVVVSLIVSLQLYWDAKAARSDAILEAQTANREADKAWAIHRFVANMLASADPDQHGRDVRVTTILARAQANLKTSFAEQPEVRSALSDTLGMSFFALGESERAEPLLRQAVELAEPRDRLRLVTHLASVLSFRNNLDEAEQILQAELARSAETPVQPRHADSRRQDECWARIQLAAILSDQDRIPEALRLLEEGISGLADTLGTSHTETLLARKIEAQVLEKNGQLSDAANVLAEVLATAQQAGLEEHTLTLLVMSNLASYRSYQGRPEEAQKLLEPCLEARSRVLGPTHPDTLEAANDLAVASHQRGEVPRAMKLFRRAEQGFIAELGPGHHRTLQTQKNLALLLKDMDRVEEAASLMQQVIRYRNDLSGYEAESISCLHALAEIRFRQGRHEEAAEIYREVLERAEQIFPLRHPLLAAYQATYGRTLLRLNKFELAEPLLLQALETLYELVGLEHRDTIHTLREIDRLYGHMGRPFETRTIRNKLKNRQLLVPAAESTRQ